MKAKTNPLPNDVQIVPLDLPSAADGCVFYTTKTNNTYICVEKGTAFPLRFIVDADGARGVCGCGGDMPCAHIAALYALPTPPVDSAPTLISTFFRGTDFTSRGQALVTQVAPEPVAATGIAAITKSGDMVSLRAKVIQLWDSTSASIGQVGLLTDGDNTIKFVKWANSGILELVEGDEYDFNNVMTDEYNGKMSIKLDKKSMVAPVGGNQEDVTNPEPAPEPEPEPHNQVSDTVVCKRCGKTLDRSDTEAVLNHIEHCKGNTPPQVPDTPATPPVSPTVSPPKTPVSPTVSPPKTPVSPTVSPPKTLAAPTVSPPVDGISNIAMAMCRVQQTELFAITDSDNPFHHSKYADLSSVWAAIRKPLTDNGLCVIQTTEQSDGMITVVTTLMHISGETLVARLSCEVPGAKPDKNGQIKPNIQGLGSTITYLRRYSLGAMIGVCPIDDDAETAHGR